jgi:Tetratricopeptide repeat
MRSSKDSPEQSGLLARIGLSLLNQKKLTDAEPLLRECLAIREKTQADDWRTFNAKSLLGQALLGQKKYAEAEPVLLAGYEGMKSREKAAAQAMRAILVDHARATRAAKRFGGPRAHIESRDPPPAPPPDDDLEPLARGEVRGPTARGSPSSSNCGTLAG